MQTSDSIDEFWFQNYRRSIFWGFPNGTAPLTGLLSLMDTEPVSTPQFGWQEERWTQLATTTKVPGSGGTANTIFYGTGTFVTSGTTVTITAGTTYRIAVTDASSMQEDDVWKIHNLPLASGTIEASFRVVSKSVAVSGSNYIEAEALVTTAAVTNNASSVVGIPVIYSGSMFAEGSRSRTGRMTYPSVIYNDTQIFKTAFEMTRTAMKAPTKYSKTGDYKKQAKGNGIRHLEGMEWALLTGDRRATTAADSDTGDTVRRSSMGGLLYYLKQWEKGSMSNGGAFDYRANATDVSAQTDFLAYPDKRIIRLGGATMSLDAFNEMEALPFQKNNSNEICKLCLCGPGYLAKLNSRLEKSVQKTEMRGEQFAGWNFKVNMRSTINGDVYYKTHPLFAASSSPYRNSAFYLDLGFLKLRPLKDSDTQLMEMIQPRDADRRKDQWLTETGAEFPFPEAHMFVDNLGGISA